MYQTGKEVEVNDYDTNIDKVCSRGIHYFKSLFSSQMWQFNRSNYTGPYVEGPYVESNYKDGERHGPFKEWYENGQQWEECNYVNGKLHGPYIGWYKNGQKWRECEYVNGELHGPIKEWYKNGQLTT
jgi:antitoxin component YwqK of YwqJK toxin-antitoxin module